MIFFKEEMNILIF